MKNFFTFFNKNQSLFYKIFLFVIATFLIIYLFPKGGHFKYNFQKGKPWQYENLYAPFTFTIKKNENTINEEIEAIKENSIPFFDYDITKAQRATAKYNELFDVVFNDTLYNTNAIKAKQFGQQILKKIYNKGVIDELHNYEGQKIIYLKKGNEVEKLPYHQLTQFDKVEDVILSEINQNNLQSLESFYNELISQLLEANVTFNKELTQSTIESAIKAINPNQGVIEKDERIIAKGEVVEGNKFRILSSLKSEYESQVWTQTNYYWLILGYFILVSLVFLMLFLFLKKYRNEIYNNNTKLTFIFFNIILMVFLTTLIIKIDANYVYIVPLCILPLILKTFFDARLGLFVHVLTILILGFIVPNSFEFLFLQIIAGIVTILTVSELYKRANLFISISQITLIYIVGYFAFFIIQEGNIELIEWKNFGYFILCGLVTLFAFPLVYVYEKMFGLVSDVSLLELSDTNSKLLKELSNKAPGTFHHSLNVANLAEAAANEIGANAMLARVGALYHDIGKMKNPTFFTENQVNSINAHDDLDPKESAQIIINHVIYGIEIARKNKLPDRIIDFIRTHHGTSLVFYFYKKELDLNEDTQKSDFMYPGPTPFSKETAILMMADSVEAASKSIKEPTSTILNDYVEKIINGQMDNGQFLNANITFKEIEAIKKVLKMKLNNMYHLRVEYPE
ncbi:MAG: HD family phosphohydrolase [Flavobacteriales bacterium]